MARRQDPERKIKAPVQESADKEVEESGPEREAPEPEHARLQNQIGNSGLAAMLANQEQSFHSEVDNGPARQQRKEATGPTHGGDDDDVADDGLLTVEELLGAANPGTTSGEDRGAFQEDMPDDELPPPDDELIASIPREPAPLSLPTSRTLDALLQPSEAIVHASLADWTRGVRRWSAPTLPWRAIAAAVSPAAPALQDPSGQVLAGRTRAGAIAVWMLLESPALGIAPHPSTAALTNFCLECEGRRAILKAVDRRAAQSTKKMPLAARLFEIESVEASTHLEPKPISRDARTWILLTINSLLALPAAATLVPPAAALEPPAPSDLEDPDDPLQLDQLLAELTGGAPDVDAGAHRAIMAAAESLAALARRIRIAYAGLAHVLHEVGASWSHGAPDRELVELLTHLDQALVEALQILVDVARATQAKRFPPPVLRKGLVRGARAIERAIRSTHDPLASLVSGLLPGSPELPPPPTIPQDPLQRALLEGNPASALPWLARHSEPTDAELATTFVRVAAGEAPAALVPALRETRQLANELGEVAIDSVAAIILGPLLLRTGEVDEALLLAQEQFALGLQRRNGMLMAQAHLLELAVYRARAQHDAILPCRRRTANALWRMGARGPLSLITRQERESSED